MDVERRRKRILVVGVVLMIVSLFLYLATLDDSDPDALPEAAEQRE